jgi:hypothetical protein
MAAGLRKAGHVSILLSWISASASGPLHTGAPRLWVRQSSRYALRRDLILVGSHLAVARNAIQSERNASRSKPGTALGTGSTE